MFERYTDRARRVIFFARREAVELGSPSIETEHLLLGVLREDRALCARILGSEDAVLSVGSQIRAEAIIREKISTSADLPVSQECTRVLLGSAEESQLLTGSNIDTPHLLLGLLRVEGSVAAQLLQARGLRLGFVREQIQRWETWLA
jgi:ATP-dependent Clp protease ATP-binding subunit ClpC